MSALTVRSLRLIIALASLSVLFLYWHLSETRYLPSPAKIFSTLVFTLSTNALDFTGYRISQHIVASLARVFYGFSVASIIAVPVGLVSGWSRYAESATTPIIELFRPIPPLAWLPFAIILFRDPLDSIFIVFLGAYFPVYLSTLSGSKTVDPVLIDAVRTLGAKRRHLFRKVIVPASIPSIVSGMRIGLGIGWMSVIAAEMVGSRTGGLGLHVWNMMEVGRFEDMWAGMFMIGLLGVGMTALMTFLQRRLLRWQRMSR